MWSKSIPWRKPNQNAATRSPKLKPSAIGSD
jgi:hypothetical protein